MPDDTFRGKRLHIIRLVAAGMDARPFQATQAALDEAEDLVDRFILLAPTAPVVNPWVLFVAAVAVTVGIATVIFVGVVLLP